MPKSKAKVSIQQGHMLPKQIHVVTKTHPMQQVYIEKRIIKLRHDLFNNSFYNIYRFC